MDGWMGGWESGFKDCLQQSKIKFEIHTSNKFNTEILKNKREKKIRKGEVSKIISSYYYILRKTAAAVYKYLLQSLKIFKILWHNIAWAKY